MSNITFTPVADHMDPHPEYPEFVYLSLRTSSAPGADSDPGDVHGYVSPAVAKLIAAAPELLEALNDLLSSHLTLMPSAEAGKEAQDAWADRRAAARNTAAALIERLS